MARQKKVIRPAPVMQYKVPLRPGVFAPSCRLLGLRSAPASSSTGGRESSSSVSPNQYAAPSGLLFTTALHCQPVNRTCCSVCSPPALFLYYPTSLGPQDASSPSHAKNRRATVRFEGQPALLSFAPKAGRVDPHAPFKGGRRIVPYRSLLI